MRLGIFGKGGWTVLLKSEVWKAQKIHSGKTASVTQLLIKIRNHPSSLDSLLSQKWLLELP